MRPYERARRMVTFTFRCPASAPRAVGIQLTVNGSARRIRGGLIGIYGGLVFRIFMYSGELDGDPKPSFGQVRKLDFAAMRADRSAGHGQTEPGAAGPATA